MTLRYEERNAKPQCFNCNVELGGNNKEYEKRLGEKEVKWLKKERHKKTKVDFNKIITLYK